MYHSNPVLETKHGGARPAPCLFHLMQHVTRRLFKLYLRSVVTERRDSTWSQGRVRWPGYLRCHRHLPSHAPKECFGGEARGFSCRLQCRAGSFRESQTLCGIDKQLGGGLTGGKGCQFAGLAPCELVPRRLESSPPEGPEMSEQEISTGYQSYALI